MKLRVMIIDDEPLARELLHSFVKRTPFLQLVETCASAEEAMNKDKIKGIDLIFLDVQMPGLLGTEFAHSLRGGPMLIFSTAYEQYALEGFKLDAIDYLLKPYGYADFLKASSKAQNHFEKIIQHSPENNSESHDFFFVRSEHRQVRIDYDKILFIEGMKDYAKIYMEHLDKPILTLMSLKSLEDCLRGRPFMRIQRSYIAHLSKIESIEKGEVSIGKKTLPISDKMREPLENAIHLV